MTTHPKYPEMRMKAGKCYREWYEAAKDDPGDEAGRRRAINRLYYSMLTYCRARLGMPLDKGFYAHRIPLDQLPCLGKQFGFPVRGADAARMFDDLKTLRVTSDYKFGESITEQDYKNAVKLHQEFIAELRHERWNVATPKA